MSIFSKYYKGVKLMPKAQKLIRRTFKVSYASVIYHYLFNRDYPLRLTIRDKQISLKKNAAFFAFLLARLISNGWERFLDTE